MDGKPWPGVFKWLADQAGVPVITSFKPKGEFTFTPPAGMTFTLGEVVDIINEGLLPFKADDEEMTPERLQEERRLMYVGITRAQKTLVVSTLRRRKKGRDTVIGVPSRFIAEMKLHQAQDQGDPKERLKRLRAELAAKAGAPASGDAS